MIEKQRCQSCGMPISVEFGNLGTNKDESFVTDYCSICYQDGGFSKPDQSLEEMIETSIDNMTNELGMPLETASELARSFIPRLDRWR